VSTTKQSCLDLSASWIAWPDLPKLQFDMAANFGLATAKIQASNGISQRFDRAR